MRILATRRLYFWQLEPSNLAQHLFLEKILLGQFLLNFGGSPNRAEIVFSSCVVMPPNSCLTRATLKMGEASQFAAAPPSFSQLSIDNSIIC